MAKYTTIGNDLKDIKFPVVIDNKLLITLLSNKDGMNDFSDISRKMMYI